VTPTNTNATDRNYGQTPFDIYDASLACGDEAKQKLGPSLVRLRADWHSTRLETERQIYFVAMQGDVGTLEEYDEVYIYCYIDPQDYEVTYFKAYDSKQKPLLSKFSFEDLIGSMGEEETEAESKKEENNN